jgi:hypothetical protein
MPRVQCPKCQHWLKVARAVAGATLQCARCGEVFVGTSQDDGPAPAGPAPARAPQAAPIIRRKKSAAPAVVTVFVALMLIPLAGLLVFGLTYKHLVLQDPDGKVVLDQWMPNAQARSAIEEHKARYEKKPAPASRQASKPMLDVASVGGVVSVGAVKGDTNFAIEGIRIIPDDEGTGGLYVGVVHNKRGQVVERVVMTLRVAQLQLSPVTLQWLAPDGRAPFTVAFTSLEESERATPPEPAFTGVELRPDLGGYDVPASDCVDEVSIDNRTVTVTGTTTNRLPKALRAARLYVDWATQKGLVQASSAANTADMGQLKSPGLTPNGKSDFTVTWNPILPGVPHRYYLRVIGTAGD